MTNQEKMIEQIALLMITKYIQENGKTNQIQYWQGICNTRSYTIQRKHKTT